MPVGVIYAVVAYSVYSCGDAIIKGFGQNLSVFEIGFFIAVFSLIPAAFAKPKTERWRDSFKLRHKGLVHLRSFSGVASSTLVTFAFVTIPFAETYSLVFMMPLFITAMSVLILKERVHMMRWAMLALGFLGVMLVVRPGFRELDLDSRKVLIGWQHPHRRKLGRKNQVANGKPPRHRIVKRFAVSGPGYTRSGRSVPLRIRIDEKYLLLA